MAKKISVSYEVQDNVPVPVARKSYAPLYALQPGQSFEFPKDDLTGIQQAAARARAQGKGKFTVRKTEEGTYRVWRME